MDSAGAYVAMTRGRKANIAIGTGDVKATLTTALAHDPEPSALEAVRRHTTPTLGLNI